MINLLIFSFNLIGSPYLVKVVDSTQSIISGQTLRMASLGKGVDFTVENRNDDAKECKVVVTSQSIYYINLGPKTKSIKYISLFFVYFLI